MLEISDKDIGGARVRRTFTNNGKQMRMGDQLTTEEVLAFPTANRRALSDSNFIEIYPKSPIIGNERFIVGIGKNQFNVIEGRVLNTEPLTREAAEKLLRE